MSYHTFYFLTEMHICSLLFIPLHFISALPDRYDFVILSSVYLPDVPRHLISDSVFCFVLNRCFRTLFGFSAIDFGLPYCFGAVIGLIPGIDSLPVTSLMIWITSVITVNWKPDPDYHFVMGVSALICPCDYRFCLTTSKPNRDFVLYIWVFALGFQSASSDKVKLLCGISGYLRLIIRASLTTLFFLQ